MPNTSERFLSTAPMKGLHCSSTSSSGSRTREIKRRAGVVNKGSMAPVSSSKKNHNLQMKMSVVAPSTPSTATFKGPQLLSVGGSTSSASSSSSSRSRDSSRTLKIGIPNEGGGDVSSRAIENKGKAKLRQQLQTVFEGSALAERLAQSDERQAMKKVQAAAPNKKTSAKSATRSFSSSSSSTTMKRMKNTKSPTPRPRSRAKRKSNLGRNVPKEKPESKSKTIKKLESKSKTIRSTSAHGRLDHKTMSDKEAPEKENPNGHRDDIKKQHPEKPSTSSASSSSSFLSKGHVMFDDIALDEVIQQDAEMMDVDDEDDDELKFYDEVEESDIDDDDDDVYWTLPLIRCQECKRLEQMQRGEDVGMDPDDDAEEYSCFFCRSPGEMDTGVVPVDLDDLSSPSSLERCLGDVPDIGCREEEVGAGGRFRAW
ncbi:unnamed protein product [Amoebophrya sp. A25]|nr:unnamed protein product [Amoebophrya sp. A25]|eukprot:GSA25T00019091001.1